MTAHFNKLTPAEAERLACLAEECAEVIQVVGKILRHGYDSHHPVSGEDNTLTLEKECGDVLAIMRMMDAAKDISKKSVNHFADAKEVRVKQYLHHN